MMWERLVPRRIRSTKPSGFHLTLHSATSLPISPGSFCLLKDLSAVWAVDVATCLSLPWFWASASMSVCCSRHWHLPDCKLGRFRAKSVEFSLPWFGLAGHQSLSNKNIFHSYHHSFVCFVQEVHREDCKTHLNMCSQKTLWCVTNECVHKIRTGWTW